MTWWPEHPDDEWVEITAYGDTEPQFIRGLSGAACEVGLAKEKYVYGAIDLDQFEAVVEKVLSC